MLDFAPFAVGVGLCLTLSALAHDRTILRCAAVLAATWVVWSAFIAVTGINDPWGLGIALNIGAGSLLLMHPAAKTQAFLGATFCVQVAAHIAYGGILITGGKPDYNLWYEFDTAVGWLQLLTVGGWAIGHNLRHFLHGRFDIHSLRHF